MYLIATFYITVFCSNYCE